MVLKVEKLVVDANAFIKAFQLQELGASIYTVPEVVKEIRDSATRKALEVIPYELILKDPSAEAVKRATEYSKSTGDYASLSLVDIKLIALSIDLFEEFNKKDIEFKTPKIQSVVGAGQPKPVHATNAESNDQKTNELETLEKDVINEEGEQVKQGQGETTELSATVTKLKASEVQEAESDEGNESGSEDESEEVDSAEEDDDDEDDDEGWITPSNYKQKFKIEEEVTLSPVGILSTDFAIQNVVLHTNIPLISPNGQQITTLRTYILRCYTCFHTTSQFEKKFCPRCGNKTLRRISVSVDENGQMKLHFSKKYVLTPRGKKFSLPKPQGGKHAVNPILTEDQHTTPNYRSKKAVQRDIGPFSMNDISTRSFIVKKGTSNLYWNAKNPNATRPKGGRK